LFLVSLFQIQKNRLFKSFHLRTAFKRKFGVGLGVGLGVGVGLSVGLGLGLGVEPISLIFSRFQSISFI